MKVALLGFRLGSEQLAVGRLGYRVGSLADVYELDYPGQRPPKWDEIDVYSWLLPKELSTVDEVEEPGEENVGTLASLFLWAVDLKYTVGIESAAAQHDRAVIERKEALRQKMLRIQERRKREIMNHPFAVMSDGSIAFVNYFGSHDEWKRALSNAFVTVFEKRKILINDAETRKRFLLELFQRALVGREKIPLKSEATGRKNFSPDNFVVAERLLAKLEKANPGARLEPAYIIKGLPEWDLVKQYLSTVMAHQLGPWFAALARVPDKEAERWINNESRLRLLAMYHEGRFCLVEGLGGYGHMRGALAYAPILAGNKRGRALAIVLNPRRSLRRATAGVNSKTNNKTSQRYYLHSDLQLAQPSELISILMHEFGHVLDAGDPYRPEGGIDQPGTHDETFNRAFQFNINLAIQAGLEVSDEFRRISDPSRIQTISNYLKRGGQLTDYASYQRIREWVAASVVATPEAARGMKRLMEPTVDYDDSVSSLSSSDEEEDDDDDDAEEEEQQAEALQRFIENTTLSYRIEFM